MELAIVGYHNIGPGAFSSRGDSGVAPAPLSLTAGDVLRPSLPASQTDLHRHHHIMYRTPFEWLSERADLASTPVETIA